MFYNREGWYTITQVHSDSLKSLRDAGILLWELIFVERQFPGIYFQRRRLF